MFTQFTHIILLLLLGFQGFESAELPSYAEKKLQKALETVYPEQALSFHPITLDSESLDPTYRLFSIGDANDNSLGYVCLAQAPSQHDRFDYAVIFDAEIQIDKAVVLIYREDYGSEIGSKRWLRQFEEKNYASPIKIGEDIQGISGATVSCRSATHSIREMTRTIHQLKQKGAL